MQETVKKDIIRALSKVYNALRENDLYQLKILSNYTIHNAGIFQDSNSINIAVILHSLGKIYTNRKIQEYKKWEEFKNEVTNSIREAKERLEKDDIEGYTKAIKDVLKNIGSLEKKFGLYITEVIEQAKIKKGSKVYEHGISAGRAAEIMGISPWELMSYIGHTKISDALPMITKTVKERLELTRKIFNVKK